VIITFTLDPHHLKPIIENIRRRPALADIASGPSRDGSVGTTFKLFPAYFADALSYVIAIYVIRSGDVSVGVSAAWGLMMVDRFFPIPGT
jgi:hypothetical protein